MKGTTLVGYCCLIVRHLVPAFGGMLLNELEPEDLQRYFSVQHDSLRPGAIGNILSLLRTVLRDSDADGKLSRQIWQYVRLPKDEKSPVRVLNRSEQTEVENLSPPRSALGSSSACTRAYVWANCVRRSGRVHSK